MTREEFLKQNKLDRSFGNVIRITTKMVKHLNTNNLRKLVTYYIAIRCLWPLYKECPIDKRLVKDVHKRLLDNGYESHLKENHDDNIEDYIIKRRSTEYATVEL